ncbi:MAG: lyase family protein, partial [Firmicutes bacterium]|nr:lyase family protein [Bacillota bacterium]
MKLWTGRFSKEAAQVASGFNASIAVDSRLARADIAGSLAHAEMLARQGIITQADGESIREGLQGILADLESGALAVDMQAEDIHTFVEAELTRRAGEAGKRLHT